MSLLAAWMVAVAFGLVVVTVLFTLSAVYAFSDSENAVGMFLSVISLASMTAFIWVASNLDKF